MISRLAKLYPLLEPTSALVGTFIFVDKQFLTQQCTAKTLPNSGENVLRAKESSSLKITSAPSAANA
jgi:hypothetical protein